MQKIKKLKDSTAEGPDGIGSKILKIAAEELSKPLRMLFNTSLATGSVLLDWKKAEVVPIFKKGTKGDTGN